MFSGETYDPALDQARLATQLNRVFDCMKDGNWHTLAELAAYSACTEAAVSARVRDFRKARFGGHTVNRRRVRKGLWEYQLVLRHDLLKDAA
jgi:hypothetical protein